MLLYLHQRIVAFNRRVQTSLLMQKTKFLLLLLLSWLSSSWAAYAQNPCNSPAPTNIQFNQTLIANFVAVTWAPVPGAASYWATFENLSNSSQVTQIANSNAPTATFSVIAGDYYLFRGAAQCLQPDGSRITSTNFGEAQYLAESIIIDLILKRSACPPNPSFLIGTIVPGQTFSHPQLATESCVLKIGGVSGDFPTYGFKYVQGITKFNVDVVDVDDSSTSISSAGLVVSPIFGSAYQPAPVSNASKTRVIQSGQNQVYEGYFTFSSTTSIFFEGPQLNSDGLPFNFLKVYVCEGGSPGNNEGDDPIPPTIAPVAQATLKNIQVVNPFSSDLTLLFQEHPTQPVTAQLCDVSGRMQLQQTIEPGSIGGNQYKLATSDLQPGMYFLRLETAPGVFSTHKIVKYDQR